MSSVYFGGNCGPDTFSTEAFSFNLRLQLLVSPVPSDVSAEKECLCSKSTSVVKLRDANKVFHFLACKQCQLATIGRHDGVATLLRTFIAEYCKGVRINEVVMRHWHADRNRVNTPDLEFVIEGVSHYVDATLRILGCSSYNSLSPTDLLKRAESDKAQVYAGVHFDGPYLTFACDSVGNLGPQALDLISILEQHSSCPATFKANFLRSLSVWLARSAFETWISFYARNFPRGQQ